MLSMGLFALAAFLHIGFFVMESLLWNKPAVRRIFRTTVEEAQTTKFLAFNQGFYNLFLAMGILAGLWLEPYNNSYGVILLLFSSTCMILASLVLATGGKHRWRGALIQGLPPLLALMSYFHKVH